MERHFTGQYSSDEDHPELPQQNDSNGLATVAQAAAAASAAASAVSASLTKTGTSKVHDTCRSGNQKRNHVTNFATATDATPPAGRFGRKAHRRMAEARNFEMNLSSMEEINHLNEQRAKIATLLNDIKQKVTEENKK